MKPKPPGHPDMSIRDAIPINVVIILTEEPDLKSNVLTLQDYVRDGKSFIPIFRSKESFKQSTGGGITKPAYQIDRRLFVSMLHGPETVILDAALPDEVVTTGDALKKTFPEPFDPSHPSATR